MRFAGGDTVRPMAEQASTRSLIDKLGVRPGACVAVIDVPDAIEGVAAVVLAAGGSTRFGGPKLLAPLDGRPVLQHVLDTVAQLRPAVTVVVLGDAADALEGAISWRGERRVRNPDPGRGLSSSLRLGVGAVASVAAGEEGPVVDAALILLGDQPRVRPEVIAALLAAAQDTDRPIVAPRYASDSAPNPVLLRRAAWAIAEEARGDRGLRPLLAARPDLVWWVPVEGANPDVDTPEDLAALMG